MNASQTTVRYYDARRVRPWSVAVVAAVLVAAGVSAWSGIALLRADSSDRTADVTAGGALADRGADEGAGAANQTVVSAVPTTAASVATTATSVAMVGDSITAGSAEAIREALSARGFVQIDVDGATNRRIGEGTGKKGTPVSGIRTVEAMLADPEIRPDVWVVALGTNDVGQYTDPEEYRGLVQAVLGLIPADVPLVWVDTYRSDRIGAAAEFNAVLVDEVGRRDRAVVASWSDQAARNAQTRVLRDDGVHPNEHGREVFAALVADAIATVA